jgi:uncharacterized protein YfaQ (DUF2300 family)
MSATLKRLQRSATLKRLIVLYVTGFLFSKKKEKKTYRTIKQNSVSQRCKRFTSTQYIGASPITVGKNSNFEL